MAWILTQDQGVTRREVPGTGLERSRVVGVYQTLENLQISKFRNASFDTHPKTWSLRPVRGRFLRDINYEL